MTKRQKTDIKNQGLTATRQSWADTPVQMGGCCRNRWADIPEYAVRNGSRKMMIGDNIYSRDNENNEWDQLNSHHSQPDGRPDASNIARDTSTNRVLISEHFIYFGESAPEVPEGILDALGYENRIGHRVFPLAEADALLGWVATKCEGDFKRVLGDPFQFRLSGARYSVGNDRIENLTVLPPGIVELNTTDLL